MEKNEIDLINSLSEDIHKLLVDADHMLLVIRFITNKYLKDQNEKGINKNHD